MLTIAYKANSHKVLRVGWPLLSDERVSFSAKENGVRSKKCLKEADLCHKFRRSAYKARKISDKIQ
jgi:hypothetical protein